MGKHGVRMRKDEVDTGEDQRRSSEGTQSVRMTSNEKVLEGKSQRGEHQENTRRATIVYNQTWFKDTTPKSASIMAK